MARVVATVLIDPREQQCGQVEIWVAHTALIPKLSVTAGVGV